MKRLIALGLSLLVTLPALAKDLNINLALSKIVPHKIQERGEDELYFDIAEYNQQGLQQFYRIPEKPIHLLSKHLAKVQNFTLWHNSLKEGESLELIISLIEEDYTPWELDDLLGDIKLKLKNDHGKLISAWSMPNTTNKGESLPANAHTEVRRFIIKEGHSEYQVDLQLSY